MRYMGEGYVYTRLQKRSFSARSRGRERSVGGGGTGRGLSEARGEEWPERNDVVSE